MSTIKDCLRRIYDGTCVPKGGLLPADHGMIVTSAVRFNHRPEVLAGILYRESRGGEILDDNGKGDQGHGFGLMQIDDRSFPAFCKSESWRLPAKNVEFGATVLYMKRSYLVNHISLAGDELERAAICAYNCGEGNVEKSIKAGEDPDSRTAGKDYGKSVLQYADIYRAIIEEKEASRPAPVAVLTPVKIETGSLGFFAFLMDLLKKLFGRRIPKENVNG